MRPAFAKTESRAAEVGEEETEELREVSFLCYTGGHGR